MDDQKTGHDFRRSLFFHDAQLVFFIISAFLLLILSTFFAVVPSSGLAGIVFNSLSLGLPRCRFRLSFLVQGYQ